MRKSKSIVWGLFFCVICLSVPREAEAGRSCIAASISESLLGGKSDTPLMPAKINDKPVALFLSYDFDSIYVENSASMNFDKYIDDTLNERFVINKFGKREKAHVVNVDKFSFGGLDIADAKLVLLKETTKQSIQGLPIVGIMGSIFLNNFSVLFDLKNKKITFFEVKEGCENKEEITTLMGENFHEEVIHNDNKRLEVPVKIAGRKLRFFIDPDLDMTEIPMDWIAEYHLPIVKKDEKTEVRFILNEGYISNIATIESWSVGDDTEKNRKIKISDKIYDGSLGLDFFSDNIVLIDSINSRMYFRKNDGTMDDPGHNLHFDTTKNANIEVK